MANATDIFAEAIELPPAQRDAHISARCNGEPGLSDEVRSLLAHHDQAEEFLDSGIARARQALLAAHSTRSGVHELGGADELTGQKIGGYTIRRTIGRGGMGTVYLAEQDQPRRTVAIKLIRPGVLSRSALRRFAAEAEALGRLHHPGIAQIYEAGSERIGQLVREPVPFIAMEYVRGRSLTGHVADRQLPVREIIALMIRVCQAIHHAHQRGVIHRDLKPANILVAEETERQRDEETKWDAGEARTASQRHSVSLSRLGQPKILDFGVARCSDGATATHLTGDGQFIGTLAYMSPEQVSGPTSDVDTRCDIYALGVILYQLLAGRLPIDTDDRSIPEVVRAILEQSPVRLGMLRRELRGDLETIVARAMDKDRERRYASAGELAEDLRRFLAGEAVEARRDSRLYVLQRGLRRHRRLVAGATAAAVGLAGFAVYATIEAGRLALLSESERTARQRESAAAQAAREAAAVAASEAQKARSVSEFLSTVLESASPGVVSGYDRTVVDVLDDASRQLADGALAGGNDVEAEVRRTLAQTYTKLFLHDAAVVHHEWLLDYYEHRYGQYSPEYIHALTQLCDAWNEVSLQTRAEAGLRRALELARETFGPDSFETYSVTNLLGNALMRQSNSAEAFQLNLDAAEGLARVSGENSVATAEARFNLSACYRGLRCREEMAALYEQARKILEDMPDDPVGSVRFRRFYVRDMLLRRRKMEAAEKGFRTVLTFATERLGADHPETLGAASFLGLCLRERGKTDEAIEILRNAVNVFTRIRRSVPGAEIGTVLELSLCLIEKSERDAAARLIRGELDRIAQICGATDLRTLNFLDRAVKLLRKRDPELSLELVGNLIERAAAAPGQTDPRMEDWRNIAAALSTGRSDDPSRPNQTD